MNISNENPDLSVIDQIESTNTLTHCYVPSLSVASLDSDYSVIGDSTNSNLKIICSHGDSSINNSSVIYQNERQELELFLLQSFDGILALNSFKSNQKVPDAYMNNVIKQIVDREILIVLKKNQVSLEKPLRKLEVSSTILKNLAAEIAKLFGGRPDIYYSPGIFEGNTKVNATGKLLQAVNYARKKLADTGLLIHKSDIPINIPEFTQTTEEKLNLLKKPCDDWSTVEKYWTDTRLVRQHLISQKKEQINVFSEYPCLSDPRATELIAADFISVYSEIKAIGEVWPGLRVVFEKLILSKIINDEFSQVFLNELPKLEEDKKDAAIFNLLSIAIISKTKPINLTAKAPKKRKTSSTPFEKDDEKKNIFGSLLS